ncbi:Ig-like domain-containing protein, partial [Granulicella rosea]
PANGATGVLLTQPVSATFSTAMNASTLNSATFTLATSSGVAASGSVTYNSFTSTATFTPSANLATSTTYVATITTGAQNAAGAALTANYVWVFRTAPAPTPPTVISTFPADKAAGVALNQGLSATFSEAMNASTINGGTFAITAPGGIAVAGAVGYTVTGSVATFTPTAAFAPLTTYVATITTGAQDLGGTALAANYVWTFTTGAAPDTTRPTVIATNPINGATGVPFNQAIGAIFSKAMNPVTITTTSFTLTTPGGAVVNGLVSYAAISNTATFTPMTNLAPSTLYTATITTVAADLAGNTLLSNYVWTFTTGPAPDTTHPTVTLTNPVANASSVPITQAVSATFSKAMDPLTINTATFTLTGPGGASVAATVTYSAISFIATLTPTVSLAQGTIYTATVTTGAADLAGNSLIAGSVPNPWIFTTNAAVVLPPVNLGTAALFGGFGGGAGMTNMGTQTVINGNIGTTGVSTLITGFHDNGVGCTYTETPLNIGYVNGSIVTAAPPPTVGCPTEGTAVTAAIAAQASIDAGTAYAALAAFPNGQDVSTCAGCGGGQAGELGNRTLVAGIYKSAPGSYAITAGDLTLDAQGNPNAFWVFQMSTTFTVGSPAAHRSVLLVNGAQAKNVFWQVGTAATINGILGGGTMTGTIISQAGISVSTAGVAAITTINGRALVLTGPVTLVNTVINVPAP